jgi:LuxR family maltose regulon positive regulatory protein
LGDIERLRGHLSEAQRMYDQASQVASEWSVRINRSLPISGGSYNALGSLFYEWNDLDQASNHFRQGIILGKRGGIVEILTAGYVGLARIECARNDIDSALDLIEKAHELIRFVTGSLHIAELMAFKATLWMMKGKPEVAKFWLDESDRLTDGRFSVCEPEFHGSVLARLLMAQGQFDKAVAILENVFPILNRAGYIDKEIELLIVMAQALGALGERYQALSKLERALTLARPGNYIRSFIDGGHFIAELLYELAAHNVELDYVEQILSAFNDQPGSGAFIANLDALSSRETEVLQLLNEGLSNQKIADKLIIASSTVKVHTRSIYSKLNVNNRQQAVARALALKIL